MHLFMHFLDKNNFHFVHHDKFTHIGVYILYFLWVIKGEDETQIFFLSNLLNNHN